MPIRKQFGPFSSSSDTKVSSSDNRIGTAGDDSPITKIGGARSKVNITTTNTYTDAGAIALVGKLIDAQSGITAGSLSFAGAAQEKLAELSATKVTDGANLNQKTTLIALAVLGTLAALFLILKRH